MPYLKAAHEWGGKDALETAISDGQAWHNSDKTVSWKEAAQDEVKGNGTKWAVDSEKDLNQEQAQFMKGSMKKLGWVETSQKIPPTKIHIFAGDKLPKSIIQQVEKARRARTHGDYM